MSKAKTKTKLHVKTGDTVIVISGKDKGKVGNIKEAFPQKGKVIVENVNMITKAMRSNPMAGIQGGLIKREAPIESSNVMLYCNQCEKPTRIRYAELEGGAKTRVCIHCDEHFD